MRKVEHQSDVERGSERATATYVQIFVYRVPKQNHPEFARAEGELADIFKQHGIVRSEFFTLTPARIFKGFTSVGETLGATPDEEVWLELDYYRDQHDRDEVIGRIAQDPRAGPLFARVLTLCAEGSRSLQGDFTSAEM
jgi:uncharacterized protein YbaA (DUF1428 family)